MGFGEQQLETRYTQSVAYEPAHWASLAPEAAAESPEPDVMRRPLRSRGERLLNLPALSSDSTEWTRRVHAPKEAAGSACPS
jgi:hypothetical protein